MRKFLCVLALAAGVPLTAGCTKSVERAQHDVRQAQNRAADNVRKEQADLQETKRDAADRIARQERRVEDAAREGNKEISKEQRDLDEARRAEFNRPSSDVGPIAPREGDRTAVPPADQPTRVDVNINRVPGSGVNVEVNRNP